MVPNELFRDSHYLTRDEGGSDVIEVLIADNNIQLCAVVTEYLNSQGDIEVVGCAYDGEEALDMIGKTEPDVVVLDITMPRQDGMAVLEQMADVAPERRPRVIVLTALARDDIAKRFTEMGADYFMLKPFDLEMLAERIRQFGAERTGEEPAEPASVPAVVSAMQPSFPAEEADMQSKITSLLHEMGMPAHFKGYHYLREAVLMAASGPETAGGSLSKEVYPALAEKYNATPGGVEAAIRNGLIACWEKGNREFLEQLAGQSQRVREGRFPTNSMIIAKLADRLRMDRRAG